MFNNSILYLSFKKPGTKDDYETLEEIAPGVRFEYDFSGAVKKREENKGDD